MSACLPLPTTGRAPLRALRRGDAPVDHTVPTVRDRQPPARPALRRTAVVATGRTAMPRHRRHVPVETEPPATSVPVVLPTARATSHRCPGKRRARRRPRSRIPSSSHSLSKRTSKSSLPSPAPAACRHTSASRPSAESPARSAALPAVGSRTTAPAAPDTSVSAPPSRVTGYTFAVSAPPPTPSRPRPRRHRHTRTKDRTRTIGRRNVPLPDSAQNRGAGVPCGPSAAFPGAGLEYTAVACGDPGPGTVADLAARLDGHRPRGGRELGAGPVDGVGGGHADRVRRPPALLGEPVRELVRSASGAGTNQRSAPTPVLLRHLGQGESDRTLRPGEVQVPWGRRWEVEHSCARVAEQASLRCRVPSAPVPGSATACSCAARRVLGRGVRRGGRVYCGGPIPEPL
jgi:hypothetical protein